MLRKAAKRHELWQAKTYLIIIPVLLISIGFSFSSQKFFPFANQVVRLLVAFRSIHSVLFSPDRLLYLEKTSETV